MTLQQCYMLGSWDVCVSLPDEVDAFADQLDCSVTSILNDLAAIKDLSGCCSRWSSCQDGCPMRLLQSNVIGGAVSES